MNQFIMVDQNINETKNELPDIRINNIIIEFHHLL